MLAGLPWTWAGQLPFAAAVERNLAEAAACRAGDRGRVLMFEPAAPVFTLGRRAATAAGQLQLAPTLATCAQRGIAVVHADRGGLGTLHLPGQLVCFVARPCRRSQLAPIVRALLQGAADLARHGHQEARLDVSDDAGLWCAEGKIAAIGLRLDRGVVCHGMAVNVAVDGALAAGLTLCGHADGRLANLRFAPGAAMSGQASAHRPSTGVASVAAELADHLGLVAL